MDFFDQNAPHAITETTQEATEFAKALQQRETFVVPTASPRMLQALARSPQAPTYRPELARPLPSRPPPPVSSPFKPFQPEDLVDLISNPSTLFLDIRPHGHWKKARVCRAISLTVPSTLLRRPAFSLDKISTMLPNSRDREEFQRWPSASTILVYDADAANLSESSNISALLTKIKAAGYTGELGYLYGGINSVLLSSLPGVIDDSQPPDDATTDSTSSGNQFIAVRQLSMSAFQQGTTTNANQRPEPGELSAGAPGPSTNKVSVANPFYDNIRQHLELSGGITERIPLFVPKKVLKRKNELPFEWLRDIALWAGAVSMANPVGAQPGSSARSATGTDSTYSNGGSSAKRIAKAHAEEGTEALAMQFYRIELGEQRRLQGVMQHHTRESEHVTKPDPISNTSDKPDYPSSTQAASIASLKTDETRSSNDTDPRPPGEPEYFPFSITAGIEKGHKNRYRNIWPFDHARIRLREATDDGSDYINASYIQPRGTRRQYIATQGPLPSTYTDFWTLVWEQGVHIIVNLTKRVEGHSAKCGLYWKDGTYGPLHLKLVKEEGGTELERAEEDNDSSSPPTGFDFAVPSATAAKKARRAKVQMERQVGKDYKPFSQETPDGEPHDNKTSSSSRELSSTDDDDDDSIIRRIFHLWHDDAPHHVRTVVQFQYVGWPDLNVPTSPKHLLKLMREVNALQQEFKESGMVGQFSATTGASSSTSGARLRAHYQVRKDMSSRGMVAKGATGTRSPTLVHCSAGVGRTGSFILIDAILDAVRREARLHLAQSISPAVPIPQPIDPTGMDQEPIEGPAPPLGADPGLVSGRSDPYQSIAHHPGGLFGSGSSLNLPEMSALSMQSPFSSSPPKQSSSRDSSLLTLDSAMQSSAELSTSTVPTSRHPSLPAFNPGSPSVLPFSSTQSFGLSRPDLSEFGSMAGSSRDFDPTKSSLLHTSAFEYTTPRQILIPRHSRQHHHASQVAKVAAKEVVRRQRHAMATSGPMDVDGDTSPPEDSPSPIGELDEPVRQVLEGIREQRMSMCQSLRQYVFVHQAILEGALQIVDEVKADLESGRTDEGNAEASGALPFTQAAGKLPPPKTTPSLSSSIPVPPPPPPPPPPPLHLGSLPVNTLSRLTAPTTGSVLGNKRLASPTELQRIDAHGASHTIHKRPSLKRINRSFDSNMESAA